MEDNNRIKEMVKQKYSEIALQGKEFNASSCCGATSACCGPEVYNIMADNYDQLQGYETDADLGLGCGLPTQFAKIKPGDVVLDLGSGAGNDCFVARHETGPSGKVIGVDFTEAMINRARANAEKLGYHNVEFRQGDIEKLPLSSNKVDVVVSNCVLNLVPNKEGVFNEIKRVLKAGGHFSISDVVLVGELPDKLKSQAELYSGCISGAIQKSEYLKLIEDAGFTNIVVQKEKQIIIPESILSEYLNGSELDAVKRSELGIYSITVFAKKAACCGPDSTCC
jgi:arsenite methyltransferase